MKKKFVLFACLVLCFGTTQTFAQKIDELKDTIVVNVEVPENLSKSSRIKTAKIVTTAGKSLDDYARLGESPPWKKFITTHCFDCQLASFDFGITSNRRINKNKVKLKIQIDFEEKKSCSTKRSILVIRGKPIKIEMKCNVNFTAYYDLESEGN